MRFAQVFQGKVKNVIRLDDESLKETFKVGYDFIVRIDNVQPEPAVGWSYSPQHGFDAPEPEIPQE